MYGKTFEEVDSNLKNYLVLTLANGQIRLTPGQKNNLKAFIQWSRDQIRCGLNPEFTPFPVGDAAVYIRRFKTHENYINNLSSMTEQSKLTNLNDHMRWQEWEETFLNYLRVIPGRDGVPLKYVCQTNPMPYPTPNVDFLDDYVAMTPLNGPAFQIDMRTVHTFITSLIAGCDTAKSKIQHLNKVANGRLDFMALREHYSGVGALAFNVQRAENIIKNLHYAGEKKPHMWWEEFEKRLTSAFVTLDKDE